MASEEPLNTGYDDFLGVLNKYKSLALSTLGGATAVPFVAYLVSIEPPWPSGVVLVTALVELVAIVVVFQFLRRASKRTVNTVIGMSSASLLCVSLVYLFMNSFFTYNIANTKERGVKGFSCVEQLPAAIKVQCPFVGDEGLKDATYRAELIWKPWSIQLARTLLAAVWLSSFLLLATLLGTFLVFQTGKKLGRKL